MKTSAELSATSFSGSATSTIANVDIQALEARIAALTEENDRLRNELRVTKDERDSYLKALYQAPPPAGIKIDYSKAELFALVGKDRPINEIAADLEKAPGA